MLLARVVDYDHPLLPVGLSVGRSLQVSLGCVTQPPAFAAAAVVSRVLSYQLTYILCSQPHGPVYKPLPAEDVEYSAWKINGHSSQLAKDHERGIQPCVHEISATDSSPTVINGTLLTSALLCNLTFSARARLITRCLLD